MKVQVRNVKYSEVMSDETMCFQADIFIDGKPVGIATNRGQGGETEFDPYQLREILTVIGGTLPPVTEHSFTPPFTFTHDAETLVNYLVCDYLDGATPMK